MSKIKRGDVVELTEDFADGPYLIRATRTATVLRVLPFLSEAAVQFWPHEDADPDASMLEAWIPLSILEVSQ